MSHSDRKRKRALKLVERLLFKSGKGVPIIVEGRRDESAIRKIGASGPVFCAKSTGKTRTDFLDSLSTLKEAVILTDFDEEGSVLAASLASDLSQFRIKADTVIWKQLKSLFRADIHSLEELPSLIERLGGKEDSI